jgi:hypothetical protein
MHPAEVRALKVTVPVATALAVPLVASIVAMPGDEEDHLTGPAKLIIE